MFRTAISFAATAAIFLSSEAPNARAGIVMDFETLEHVDGATNFHGSAYSEDGFTITADQPDGLVTFGTLDFRYSGSTALGMRFLPQTTTLSKDGGGFFGITSIDLAEGSPTGIGQFLFTGTLAGGGTTQQSFELDGVRYGAETFLFDSAFQNIESLSWTQTGAALQIDNVHLTAVPEPSSILTLGFGLAVMGLRRRRTTTGT